SLRLGQLARSAPKPQPGGRVVKRHIMEGRRYRLLAHVVDETVAVFGVVHQQIKDMAIALPIAGDSGKRDATLRREVAKCVHVPIENAPSGGVDLVDSLQLGIEER